MTEVMFLLLTSTTFAGVTFPSYGRPTLADFDNDGDYDLTIGDGWGTLNIIEMMEQLILQSGLDMMRCLPELKLIKILIPVLQILMAMQEKI